MMNSRTPKRQDGMHGPFRGLRRSISKILESKTFLKIFALVTAIMIWSVLVASDGTLTREKVFPNAPVSVSGETVLKSRGYIVMDDISKLLPEVKLTVDVTQASYSRATSTAFNPHIDLTDVKGEGENVVNISYLNASYGTVVSCEPSTVTLNVERYITRRVPVTILQTGELPEGIFIDSTRTDPSMLSVSGPLSLVAQAARAVATLELSELSLERASDRMALKIELQNAAGEPLTSRKLEITNQTVITDSVIAEIELLPMRSVPLDLAAFVKGEPAPGYELEGVYAETTALDVSARPETLENISILTTDSPIDIEGATADVSGYVRLKRPAGIENTVPTDVAVTARIVESSIERTFRSVPVAYEGAAADQRVTLMTESMRVQLAGGYTFIDALKKEDVRLYVDVSGLAPGDYTLPVQIHIDNAEPFGCALGSPEIEVRIREKEIK